MLNVNAVLERDKRKRKRILSYGLRVGSNTIGFTIYKYMNKRFGYRISFKT